MPGVSQDSPPASRSAPARPALAPELVHEYLRATGHAPEGALPLDEADDLPQRLARVARSAERRGATWRAWTRQSRVVRFMTAAPLPAVVEGAPAVALEIRFYDLDARPMWAGVWVRHDPAVWRLSFVADPTLRAGSSQPWPGG